MKRLSILVVVVLAVGCSRSDEEKPMPQAHEASGPLAAYAGTWNVQAFAMNREEPLVDLKIIATDSKEGWSMVFSHLDAPVPAHHVTVRGDSVSFTVGPYSSALRANVMVTTTSVVHVHGYVMTGRFTANYDHSDPPVLRGLLEGTRADDM